MRRHRTGPGRRRGVVIRAGPTATRRSRRAPRNPRRRRPTRSTRRSGRAGRRADQSIELDDPGDGLPEDGPADDAVTDVDPRPQRSREPVVTPVADTREQPQAEGIGQRLGNMAHLSANPRMRAWQRRVIVAVIAGLVFGILLHDWRWGLTFAVLAAIADTIIRSRTVFNGPGGRPADPRPEEHAAAAQQPGAQGLPGHARPAHPGQRGADRPPGDRPGGRVRHRLRGLGQADAGADEQPPAAVARAAQHEGPARARPLGG